MLTLFLIIVAAIVVAAILKGAVKLTLKMIPIAFIGFILLSMCNSKPTPVVISTATTPAEIAQMAGLTAQPEPTASPTATPSPIAISKATTAAEIAQMAGIQATPTATPETTPKPATELVGTDWDALEKESKKSKSRSRSKPAPTPTDGELFEEYFQRGYDIGRTSKTPAELARRLGNAIDEIEAEAEEESDE
jgi:hypothetical protein